MKTQVKKPLSSHGTRVLFLPAARSDPEISLYPKVISCQFGRSKITQIEEDVILKQGSAVWPNEEAAINLVQAHAADVPVPTVYHSIFSRNADGVVRSGMLYMEFIPGESLKSAWPRLSGDDRKRICRDTWVLIDKLRLIPVPQQETGEEMHDGGTQAFYCAADGTSSIIHPLLGDIADPPPPLRDDEALRTRIWERYVEYNGLSYPDGQSVRELLPRSETAVFTHGDIHPGNIIVNDNGGDDGSSGQVRIVGLVDFESAGFLPDYWEYAQAMRFGGAGDREEWRLMMEQTAPRVWDITGIQKARRVLF
jgi:serine/threonine protein kinase